MSSDPVPSPIPIRPTAEDEGSKRPMRIPGMPSIGICSCGTQLGAHDKIASGISQVALWLWWIAERLSCASMREEACSWLGRTLVMRERAEAHGLCLLCLLKDFGAAECQVVWRTVTTDPREGLCHPHSLLGASALASRLADALPAGQALAAELRGAALELAAAAEFSAARTRGGQEGSDRGAAP